jgi:acyl-CoA thioester hydrolase
VKIKFSYEIRNQENQVVCLGNTSLAFLNSETRKPIRCPENFSTLFRD